MISQKAALEVMLVLILVWTVLAFGLGMVQFHWSSDTLALVWVGGGAVLILAGIVLISIGQKRGWIRYF